MIPQWLQAGGWGLLAGSALLASMIQTLNGLRSLLGLVRPH